jgi:hypothetical protein
MIDLKKFLNEDQDPKAVEKIVEKVKGLLIIDESIEYIAVQRKPAINLSPDCIALTNKRVIFCRPKNLGFSMEFEDFLWKDVGDTHIKEGILGAEFSVKTISGYQVILDYLPKSQARKLYQFSQGKEEEMNEFRRQRDLEEKRAAAGGVTVNNNSSSNQVPNNNSTDDPTVVLQKLKTLLDNGILSKDEFERKKTEILSRM